MSDSKFIKYYDDPDHDYEDFWVGREYEHLAEIVALKDLLADNHFDVILDYGGGYGRLSKLLLQYAGELYLVDPSSKQLRIARQRLKNETNIKYLSMDNSSRIPIDTNSVDFVVMVRVMHHLADPKTTFAEIKRVLKPGGRAVIEVANYSHILNRLKYYAKFQHLPKKPVKIGEIANGINDNTPFLNHNLKVVIADLEQQEFTIVRKLSVSNLRSTTLKKSISLEHLMLVEKFLQAKLAFLYFGPSIFLLIEKPMELDEG